MFILDFMKVASLKENSNKSSGMIIDIHYNQMLGLAPSVEKLCF